jgi:hypothetical protein
MKTKLFLSIGLAALLLLAFTSVALAGLDSQQHLDSQQREDGSATTLVETVRQATKRFKNVEAAEAADYELFLGCVSGPEEGAMGIHFTNGDLVGDGELDPSVRRRYCMSSGTDNCSSPVWSISYSPRPGMPATRRRPC